MVQETKSKSLESKIYVMTPGWRLIIRIEMNLSVSLNKYVAIMPLSTNQPQFTNHKHKLTFKSDH
jgi:hypothetical protein